MELSSFQLQRASIPQVTLVKKTEQLATAVEPGVGEVNVFSSQKYMKLFHEQEIMPSQSSLLSTLAQFVGPTVPGNTEGQRLLEWIWNSGTT